MKIQQIKSIVFISFLASLSLKAADVVPILSKRLQAGNQISKIIQLDGTNHNVSIDGKYTFNKESKFVESIISFEMTTKHEAVWKNALKSKFKLSVAESAKTIVFSGSESNYVAFDGWTVLVDHKVKFDESSKIYKIDFWALIVRGYISNPVMVKNSIRFPEKDFSKTIKIEDNDSLSVYLGSIEIK